MDRMETGVLSEQRRSTRQRRSVKAVVKGVPVSEGAGVRLTRLIGHGGLRMLDPFLLFDEFRSEKRDDYAAGFPDHPHRGMETVTYMIEGRMAHRDSLGNSGVIGPGDAQWMTAGSGIIHSEMPAVENGRLWGLQLWVNLPAVRKMMPPRYQELSAARMPFVTDGSVTARVIAGAFGGVQGACDTIGEASLYLDVTVSPDARFTHILTDDTAFAFVLDGHGVFADDTAAGRCELLVFDGGDEVVAQAGSDGLRFILVAGAPIGEPVVSGGPFVMNTQEEIETAWKELRNGTFVKSGMGGRRS